MLLILRCWLCIFVRNMTEVNGMSLSIKRHVVPTCHISSEKGATEDEIVGWHHQVNGHEFEQAPRDSEGQEAWRAAVYGVTKSQTWLSNWTTTTVILHYLAHLSISHSRTQQKKPLNWVELFPPGTGTLLVTWQGPMTKSNTQSGLNKTFSRTVMVIHETCRKLLPAGYPLLPASPSSL